jgi:hypothetical protein
MTGTKKHTALVILASLLIGEASAQSIKIPWSNYGHDPQHNTISPNGSQSLNNIRWQTPVDLNPQYDGNDLFIHYGSPVITRSNTIVIPVKTGATDGFKVDGRDVATGTLKWTITSDYTLPPHNWVPSFGITLTPKNRVYLPGAGGTVYYRDNPDATGGSSSGQIAFYGLNNYNSNPSAYQVVQVNTPLTTDRYGNIFFGFTVPSSNSVNLQNGVARIGYDGTGSWVSANTLAAVAPSPSPTPVAQVVQNCTPALSNDHKTLYIAVRNGGTGYLVAADSRTLAPISRVRLKDVLNPSNDASLSDDGTASPTVGPDGDVYYGVLENPYYSNHLRGWLLHFDSTLTQSKQAGAFGWDDTASIVPASLVPSYQGSSAYLVLTKYNNYVEGHGDGVNKLAVLDPNDHMTDPISGAQVMKEIITIAGPTPDQEFVNEGYPNAVREWCINTAGIDPATKSALVNNEDGKMYRWSFTTNTLTETVTLTPGIGEAYTPTLVGMDGTVFAINNATLFALGQ